MWHPIKTIRKVDIEKQYEKVLQLELDYELASLYEAMQNKDKEQIRKSKKRLTEITDELNNFQ